MRQQINATSGRPAPGGLQAWQKAGARNWKASRKDPKAKAKEEAQKILDESGRPENQLLERGPEDALKNYPLKLFFYAAVGVTLLALCLVGLARMAHSHKQLGLEVSRLTREQVRLSEINRELKMEIAKIMVLEDLEAIARGTLGLRTPSLGQIVVIE
jgi:cell division protein FtsL